MESIMTFSNRKIYYATKLAQMGTYPGILGNARACLVGHLGRKMLSQAQSSKVQA